MKKLLMCGPATRLAIVAILGFIGGYLLARDHFTLGLPIVALAVVFILAPFFIKDTK